MTKSRDAVRAFTRTMRDQTGNQPPLPAIFPNQLAPVVATSKDGTRTMLNMRWGFPPPASGRQPVTNVRNLESGHWRDWIDDKRFRCLVPATSFVEYTDSAPKIAHWFALGPERPLFCFAGIWRPWTGVRGKEDGQHLLFAFLTTEPNALVQPIHAKAMPVLLSADTMETWLTGSAAEARALARPFPAEQMQIVLSGPKEDPAP